MRSFARIMVAGGLFLFLLAAYSQTGYLDKAAQVADVLAMGTSLLVSIAGLAFLLVTRGDGAGMIRPRRHGSGSTAQNAGGGFRHQIRGGAR